VTTSPRRLALAWAFALALLRPADAPAQPLPTVELAAPAAEVVPETHREAVMNLRMKESIFNRKEQRLDKHYRTVPVPKPPAGTPAQKEIPPPAQTKVADLSDGVATPGEGAIRLLLNKGLTRVEAEQRSVVGEPTAALTDTGLLFVTGNWYAAFKTDPNPNAVFRVKDPFTAFPRIPNRPGVGFCCDQIVQFDPTHKALIWFLQYVTDAEGNVIRLGVETGRDLSGKFEHFTPSRRRTSPAKKRGANSGLITQP